MDYSFSIAWMFGGLAIALIGGLVVLFYKQIADGLANGVTSYDKVKLFGVILILIGLICAANLHTFLLSGLVNLMFNREG